MSSLIDRPNAPESEQPKAGTPISIGSEWNFDVIQKYDEMIAKCAAEFGLEPYHTPGYLL